ncbi:uncharacterized protein LOC127158106 [Labeo rohita]|uniref:uncharacterized protein LOC127158106 n=1 Tax=Labeo rohita TaxID=84645 RepID=UPI0021E22BC9|nr:uncharacterized protein LOC127158106 [Labeo rohita]
MELLMFTVLAVIPVISDGLVVHGPSGPLVAPLGSSVVLPCYVSELLLMEGLEVEWRRTDSETLVHLFLGGKSRPESQQQDYHDRAHFFIDQIQHGNFSLRLDNLRAEDEGKYTCRIHSQQDFGETVVQLNVEHLLVSGSSCSISASVGEDVTLNCSVDFQITSEPIKEVSWRKTNKDEYIQVLLYQNNETFSDSSDERYRDRVEFFTAEIPKGNFSLRLRSVRTEDKGVYMCQVFAGGLSANATVVLERLGFSALHIFVLVFCFAASAAVLQLLSCLIYCRSRNTVTNSTIRNLKWSLVFCPNICMFFAFIFWGLTEGFLYETITCCAFYILRPVMLKWASSRIKILQDSQVRFASIRRELAVFTVIVYSAFFIYAWMNIEHAVKFAFRIVVFGLLFGFVVVLSLALCRAFSCMDTKWVCLYFLSLAQLFLLICSFGLPSPVFLAEPGIQSVLLVCISCKFLHKRWKILLWIITLMLLDLVLVIYVHVRFLERDENYLAWAFAIIFLEVLRITVAFEDSDHADLCIEIMYMFGAFGLVLVNSVALTVELFLSARNGERVIKDLRYIVLSSECVFVLYFVVLQIHACCKYLFTIKTFKFATDEEQVVTGMNAGQRGEMIFPPN